MNGYAARHLVTPELRHTAVRYRRSLAVATAIYVALWVQPLLDPSVVLLVAVVVAAWFSGLWPAMFASALATLALDYFFTTPVHTLRFDFVHIPRLAVFTAVAGLFTSVSARRRRAERSLQQIRDELDATVQQRTAELTRAHTEAVAAQQRFTDLMNSIEGIVWEADANTLQFFFVSNQAQRMLGYPVDHWLRDPNFWKDHNIHPDDRDWAAEVRLGVGATLHGRDSDNCMIASDGHVVWVRDLVNVIVENGHVVTLRGVTFNVTRRKAAEQQLEELAGRLIHAQEERSRIGRELHDHISQMLGVLTIRMDQLRVDASTPPEIAATLEQLRKSAAEITDDIHSLSHRLHSSALDYLGLVAALKRLVTEFSSRHAIEIICRTARFPTRCPPMWHSACSGSPRRASPISRSTVIPGRRASTSGPHSMASTSPSRMPGRDSTPRASSAERGSASSACVSACGLCTERFASIQRPPVERESTCWSRRKASKSPPSVRPLNLARRVRNRGPWASPR